MRVFEPNHSLYAEIEFNLDDKGMITGLFAKRSVDADIAKYSSFYNELLIVLEEQYTR